MTNRVVVYSKPDCPHCVTAKNILKANEVEFDEIIIGSDISLDEFKEKNPTVRSVPAIFLDGNYMGGSASLPEVIKQVEI